jgi:signal transduction histidine kinase
MLPLTARSIYHDLRQPIATVRALADLVLADPTVPDQVRARVDAIRAQAALMADLCNDRVDRRQVRECCDLAEIVTQVTSSVAVRFDGHLLLHLDSTVVPLDELSAWRFTMNIVDNACRAAGPAGTVWVRTWSDDDAAWLAVDDDRAARHYPPGAGLGLLIVRTILERVGGRLERRTNEFGGARIMARIPWPAPASDALRPGSRACVS